MKLPSFDYVVPKTLNDAVALLNKHSGDAKIIAGGQSLLPIMAFRLAAPALLVDIREIPDLRRIQVQPDGLHLGPLVRWRDLECSEDVAKCQPLLRSAVANIAHYQVRNRGTVGGSLAHADPAAEFPCIAVTCDAIVTLHGSYGSRTVAADDFLVGELETVLQPDEVITDIHFPVWPNRRRSAFIEFSKRRGDFALGGVAAYLDVDQDGTVSKCAIGMMGASPRAQRLSTVEAMLVGSQPNEGLMRSAGIAASDLVNPQHDIHASRNYRKALIGTLVERALTAAMNETYAGTAQ
ncbi:FAD binding domain-containing protein [Bradyrhizobium sp. SYSU BS000235]|uniref:FAD binding domain-containing protein n=1 Tax=Bradyrhizobium sp. SYSU BS000235 TaxID=3411332 RepID=UPI003C7443DC